MLKYLEIDSTYRNRKLFPLPTVFDVITNQTGTRTNLLTSICPIANSAPIITYVPSDINSIVATSVQASDTNTESSFIVGFPVAQNANRLSNYYRGTQVNITVSTPADLGRVTIDTWDYLNTSGGLDNFRVTFYPSIDPTEISIINSFQLFCSTNFPFGNVFIPTGTAASQFYVGSYIYNETQNQSSVILAYDGPKSLASMAPQATWNLTDTISLRKELPITYNVFQAGCTTSTVVLDASSNPVPNSLVGLFIRFTQPGSADQNKIYDIVSYSGSPNFIAAINGVLPVAPSAGDTYEILSFTKDGFVPLNYNGTQVSQDVCYEVQLVNLILPNISILTGGLTSSYPYLYVDFQNYSTSSGGTTNLMYSNNPNSTRRLFRVPVSDVSPPSLNSFLTLDKCYMAQMVRISPNSNFRFGVYLPDGTPVCYCIQDTTSPTPPNENIQVSALFSLRRLSS